MTKYPFKFLDAYQKDDIDIFFGREKEVEALYEMVFETNILFLYGASGTGKTSLLRCGLANQFKETHWSELFVLRGANINQSLLEAIKKNTPKVEVDEFDFSDELDALEENTTSTTESEATHPVVQSLEKLYRSTFNPIYLIFDQFEELYILGDEKEQTKFIKAVKAILASNLPCRLLFSMREEYLANLYEFEKEIPELLDRKMRVAPMDYQTAENLILKATETQQSNVHLTKNNEKAVAKAIIDKIREKRINVQLPIFQMMMDSLYVKATGEAINRTQEANLSLELIEQVGTIEDLLTSFLNGRVNVVYQKLKKDFPTIPDDFVWQVLSPFVTLEGTKAPLNNTDLYQKLKKYPQEWTLNCRVLLEENRILRYREEGDLYELMHDVLAKEVRKHKDEEQVAVETAERLIRLKFPIWMSANQDAEKLLPKGDLAIISPWLSHLNLYGTERAFIKKSQALADAELIRLKEEAEKEVKLRQAAERNERKARLFTYIASGLVVLALIAAYFAFTASQQAQRQSKIALEASEKAKAALAENIKNQKMAAAQELINYAQSYCDLEETDLALKRLEAAKDSIQDYPSEPLYQKLEQLIENPCQ